MKLGGLANSVASSLSELAPPTQGNYLNSPSPQNATRTWSCKYPRVGFSVSESGKNILPDPAEPLTIQKCCWDYVAYQQSTWLARQMNDVTLLVTS